MKKIAVFLLATLLLFASVSMADVPDLSGLSFDELVTLREQMNLAIWNSQEWQEVTVPAGVWKIGEDIPAGHWSIRIVPKDYTTYVAIFSEADETGKEPARGCTYYSEEIAGQESIFFDSIGKDTADFELQDGWYIKFSKPVTFTPYAGKPDLGFK